MIILCPACSLAEKPVVIDAIGDRVWCEQCHRRYEIQTLVIKEKGEEKIDGQWSNYTIYGRQENGLAKTEGFSAQARLPLSENHQITIARRGNIIVGIADQEQNTWMAVRPHPRKESRARKLSSFLLIALFIVALLQGGRLVVGVKDAALEYGAGVVVGTGLLLVFLAMMPALFWIIKVYRQKDL